MEGYSVASFQKFVGLIQKLEKKILGVNHETIQFLKTCNRALFDFKRWSSGDFQSFPSHSHQVIKYKIYNCSTNPLKIYFLNRGWKSMSVYDLLKIQVTWKGGFISPILDYIKPKIEMRDIAFFYHFQDGRLELPTIQDQLVVATQKTGWLYALISTPVCEWPESVPCFLHPFLSIKSELGRDLYRVCLYHHEHVVEYAFHFAAQMFCAKAQSVKVNNESVGLTQKWNMSVVLPHQALYDSMVAFERHIHATYEVYPQEIRKRVRKRCCIGERWSLRDLSNELEKWFAADKNVRLSRDLVRGNFVGYIANYLWCKWTMDELNQILRLIPRE